MEYKNLSILPKPRATRAAAMLEKAHAFQALKVFIQRINSPDPVLQDD
jgi:hypothetical protein